MLHVSRAAYRTPHTEKTRTQPRSRLFWWGIYFFGYAEKYIPHPKGDYEGTWFPHTPTGNPC
jgi:hypothetical protein